MALKRIKSAGSIFLLTFGSSILLDMSKSRLNRFYELGSDRGLNTVSLSRHGLLNRLG